MIIGTYQYLLILKLMLHFNSEKLFKIFQSILDNSNLEGNKNKSNLKKCLVILEKIQVIKVIMLSRFEISRLFCVYIIFTITYNKSVVINWSATIE